MELDKRKIYLIAGVVALVVVMVIGFFYYNSVVSKNKETVATSTGPSTSGTGTLGTLPPLETTQPPTRPATPVLHTSSSEPYATIAPRANEPAPTPTPVAYVPAPQPTQPTQAVNQSGMDSSMAFQYNDLTSLNETQLMQKYTPNYQNINQDFEPPTNVTGSGGTGSGSASSNGVAANGTDGVLTVAETGPVSSVPSSTTPSGTTLNVNQMNCSSSLASYMSTLSSTLAPFNISNPANSSLVSSAVTDAISDPSKFKADQAAGQNMLAQLQALPVPSDLAGLQESYYNLYSDYNTLLQDAAGVSSGDQATAIASDTAVQNDAGQFGIDLETTLDDQTAAQAIVQSAPAGSGSGSSCSGAAGLGVQGYDSSTQQFEATSGVLSSADDYLVLYDTFGASGNSVAIDGQNVTTSYQSAAQINVPVASLGLSDGSHTVTVNGSDGTSESGTFTVNQ